MQCLQRPFSLLPLAANPCQNAWLHILILCGFHRFELLASTNKPEIPKRMRRRNGIVRSSERSHYRPQTFCSLENLFYSYNGVMKRPFRIIVSWVFR
ncbi:hypothetical protein TNIN_439071 [Trichonephila inaurata madagascariensis]|uniref:Uncharacterized protein n=1 Tax=Trichonephila inaurata madagascariensis TaxID=2747483 RepID=A0A8X6YPV1_9ARAC|nr:hypothetical protein TNIN_439071 [Trichonephila inaurata madagascariensis]